MKYNRLIAALLGLTSLLAAQAQLTLDGCLAKAEENYPLIRKYGLADSDLELSLSDINRGWLPRIGVGAQATVQNVVPEFPETLRNVLASMGREMKGLGRVQYKAQIELQQTLWDGGVSAARREIERENAAVSRIANTVELYRVREQVINLYFGILLMDEQMAQTQSTIGLLAANRQRLRAMVDNGTAMQADADMVEAEELAMTQRLVSAQSAARGYRELLGLYIGEDVADRTLERPAETLPAEVRCQRPELELFDARTRLNALSDRMARTSLMPKFGFFAQAYYGYPGFDYFRSMTERSMSFNVMAGVKVSWNIDAFYTRRNSRTRTANAAASIDAERETFLFGNRLQTASQTEAIEGLRRVMADDERIVALRTNVRNAAEAQLLNGVIDATALLSKITDENRARLQAVYHRIQLLQNISQLKFITNQ